jgi:hypothetical protein
MKQRRMDEFGGEWSSGGLVELADRLGRRPLQEGVRRGNSDVVK